MSQPTCAQTRINRLLGVVLLVLVTGVALLPWWRNRGYVRDFFDYGVVIGGVGRLEQGQRPYVDFITPIQTAWYGFNWAAEKLFGGTFQAMTWSGAASIVLAVICLGGIFLKRWPWWAAGICAGAIVCASVSHHTIFWYNPWGVVLLVTAACASALAPVLRRETAAWHALVVVALFLGGINKINIQLLALALVFGWAGRAALLGKESWLRALSTAVIYGVCGVVIPVLAEMAWTGASFDRWWHNVIAQMGGDRAGMMLVALKWETYLKPCHDYYDALFLPQIGLTGVVLTLITVTAILWHQRLQRGWMDKILACACGVIAVAAGMLLLTTNMDIAYIALAGWLGLLVALWFGFGLPARGPWFTGGLVVPSLLIGLIAWESAWRGQRSQFGYSTAPRAEYLDASEAGSPYAYFRGTRVTPEMFVAFKSVANWRATLPEERQNAVLFGPGSEWMAHVWPALHTPDLPLYILGGYQFGPKEYAATFDALNGTRFKEITVSHVLDIWKPEFARILRIKFIRYSLGEVFQHYSRSAGDRLSESPVPFSKMFGGTTDSRSLSFSGQLIGLKEDSEDMFLGTTSGKETMRVHLGANRLKGEVVLKRVDPNSSGTLAADFNIFAEGGGLLFPRWAQRVELPDGQNEIRVEYSIDGSGFPTRYDVEVPPEFAGKVAAGWRAPMVTHAFHEGPEKPLWVFPVGGDGLVLTAQQIESLLPAQRNWTPSTAIVRGGSVTDDGLVLEPGGELWIRVEGMLVDFAGVASFVNDNSVGAQRVAIRGMWMKSARLETFTQNMFIPPVRSVEFRSWSPEPGGWVIIAMDPAPGVPSVRVRIDRFNRQD